MKTRFTVLILLFCICFIAKAQTQDSLASYRNSLGITVNPIYKDSFIKHDINLAANNPIMLGLLYKMLLEKNSFLRLSLSGLYVHDYSDLLAISEVTKYDGFALDFKIGYERENQIINRLKMGHGIDISTFYFLSKKDINKIYLDTNQEKFTEVSRSNTNTSGLAIQPFINIQFAITSRLSIGLESKASLDIAKSKYRLNGTINELNEGARQRGTVFGGHEKLKITSTFRPISSIQLIHSF